MSNDGNGQDVRLAYGPPGMGQSYSSSPRINISQLSSDMNSSRASTMRQMEKEVKKLATAEEQSRKVALRPHSGSCSRGSHSRHRRNLRREEPEREDGAVWSGYGRQSVQGNTPESTASDGRMSFRANEPSSSRRVPAGSSSSELQSAPALPISEESSTELPVSESQISRQGDGRESKDKNQSGKAGLVPATSVKALTFKPPSGAGVTASEPVGAPSSTVLSRDFGQMFPSSECIMVGHGSKGESVGVQTSNSLLYPKKSSKKRDNTMSVSTSDKESTAESLKNKKTRNRGKPATESNEDADNAKKHVGRSGHKRPSDMRKPSSSRKDGQEETSKPDDVHKEKKTGKEKNRERECKSKSLKEASNNNRKHSERSSKRETVKNKYLPQKDLKLVPQSGRKGTAEVKNRAPVPRDTGSGPEDRELSSRPTSESEDRTMSSVSSLSHSIQSISHISSEQSRLAADQGESTENDGSQIQYSEDNSTECSKEPEHHPQLDLQNITNEDSTNQGHQSSAREQCIGSDGQANTEEFVEGLKGGAEDSLIQKAPTLLLISPPEQNGMPKPVSRSIGNTYAKHKSTNAIISSRKTERENLKNKKNVAQHHSEEERHPVAIIQGSDSQRQESQRSGTLKVAWVKDKEKEIVTKKKPPVRFDVNFSNQEKSNLRKSKFPVTTTTTTTSSTNAVMQEELNQGTKSMTLQVKTLTVFCFISLCLFSLLTCSYSDWKRLMSSNHKFCNSSSETLLTFSLLQEALARARPDYLREAGDRTALIRLKREMRRAAQTQNHNVLAQIPPNLQTPSTLQRFLYKPGKCSSSFSLVIFPQLYFQTCNSLLCR